MLMAEYSYEKDIQIKQEEARLEGEKRGEKRGEQRGEKKDYSCLCALFRP